MPLAAAQGAGLWAAALSCLAFTAVAAEPGQPLTEALEQLVREGFRVVFSDAVVDPALRVVEDPGPGTLEERASRMLAPHGLALEQVQPGVFAVIARGRPAPAQPPAAVPGTELAEVRVYASRYRLDTERGLVLAELRGEDLEALPGIDQDAMRVVRYLPGIASNGLTARAHVRGGYENEVAVYFDGAPLFEPYHFKDFYAPLGMLDPGAIGRVDFYSGVPPPRYGNRLSGVLDMTPREWSGRDRHELGLSLLYAHALSQGRLEDRPVEWLGAYRRSVVNDLLELADKRSGQPQFADALARLRVELADGGELVGGLLSLDDSLRLDLADGTERARARYRDRSAWLRGVWPLPGGAVLEGTLAHSARDSRRQGELARPGSVDGSLEDRRDAETVSAVVGLSVPGERWRLRLHGEWQEHEARFDFARSAAFEPLLAQALGRPASIEDAARLRAGGNAYAAAASLQVTASERLTLDFGLRWDAQRYSGGFAEDQLSPRVAAQYALDEDTVLRLSWGRLAQAQRPDELQVADGEAGFHVPARATQAVLALERRVSRDAVLRLEAFDKRIGRVLPAWENVLDPRSILTEIEPDRLRIAPESSRVYGTELSGRWEPGRTWSAWLAYAWSEATDEFPGFESARSWNQKHAIVLGVAWTRMPWQLSANGRWNSGWRRNTLDLQSGLSPRNAQSWPDARALDLRASWTRPLPIGALNVFAEVSNLFGQENLCCTAYAVEDLGGAAALVGEVETWIPRYALVGVKWTFP